MGQHDAKSFPARALQDAVFFDVGVDQGRDAELIEKFQGFRKRNIPVAQPPGRLDPVLENIQSDGDLFFEFYDHLLKKDLVQCLGAEYDA